MNCTSTHRCLLSTVSLSQRYCKPVPCSSQSSKYRTSTTVESFSFYHPVAIMVSQSSNESDVAPSPPPSKQKKGKRSARGRPASARGQGVRKKAKVPQGPRMQVVGSKKVLIGQTPRGIRRCVLAVMKTGVVGGFVAFLESWVPRSLCRVQFKQLATALGEDPIKLAERILYSSAAQRSHLLKTFYSSQDPDLAQLFPDMAAQKEEAPKRTQASDKG